MCIERLCSSLVGRCCFDLYTNVVDGTKLFIRILVYRQRNASAFLQGVKFLAHFPPYHTAFFVWTKVCVRIPITLLKEFHFHPACHGTIRFVGKRISLTWQSP